MKNSTIQGMECFDEFASCTLIQEKEESHFNMDTWLSKRISNCILTKRKESNPK
jgi:hypothetical protein